MLNRLCRITFSSMRRIIKKESWEIREYILSEKITYSRKSKLKVLKHEKETWEFKEKHEKDKLVHKKVDFNENVPIKSGSKFHPIET